MISKFLLEKGYNVYGASRDAQTSPFINLKKLGIKDEIKLLSINITDFGNTLECINKIKPDDENCFFCFTDLKFTFSKMT
jgi:GDPmannose 4,6-dehydratase